MRFFRTGLGLCAVTAILTPASAQTASPQTTAAADATFSFTSEDSTIASVDPSTGLVTFLPQEEEEGSDCPTCRILVTATLAGQSPQTIEIRLTGASIEDTYYVPDTINGTDTSENNVGNYVLVLYNADSTAAT